MLAQPPYCSPCHQWRSQKHHQQGACRRCGRVWLVNADGLCRPCIGEIQESDAAWYFDPATQPRPVQLVLILPGLRLPPRMPFGSYRARSDGRFHPPLWARAQRPAELADDPRFCPSAVAGQLPLFQYHRTLAVGDAHKIQDRVLAGHSMMEPVAAAYAAQHEYGKVWRLTMDAVLRLALAVREADGKLLVDEAVLDALPRFAGAAAEILRRAGLLDPVCSRSPGQPAPGRPGAAELSDLRGVGYSPQMPGVPGVGDIRRLPARHLPTLRPVGCQNSAICCELGFLCHCKGNLTLLLNAFKWLS